MQAMLIKLSRAEKKSHEDRSGIRWEEGDAVRVGGAVRGKGIYLGHCIHVYEIIKKSICTYIRNGSN